MPIIDCITHLLLMTLHSECCLIGRYPIWFTNVPMSSANLIFILSTVCGTRAVDAISCVQKSKKHFKLWLRQTVTNARLSFVFTRTRKSSNQSTTCFSNLHRRNYCPVNKDAVAVRRSDWLRAKWDHAFAISDDWTFYDKPWGIGLAAIFWSFVT